MSKRAVFIDSDVIISSLLSSTGAGYILLKEFQIERYISNKSQEELGIVTERLKLIPRKLQERTSNCKVIKLKESHATIHKEFSLYVFDTHDAHIVAGAKQSKAKFLVTYNIRHFKVDKIKEDFGIIVLRPAQLLQYLRSKE